MSGKSKSFKIKAYSNSSAKQQDVNKETAFKIEKQETVGLSLTADAKTSKNTGLTSAIFNLLASSEKPLTNHQISESTGFDLDSVRSCTSHMTGDGKLKTKVLSGRTKVYSINEKNKAA